MNLICYLPADLAANHPLRLLMLHGLPKFTRQVYESLSGLERRLTCPGEPESILVLVVPDHQALQALVAMGDLCQAHPVVLVLPEDQDGLHGLGHRLRPRFMTSLACAEVEIEAVLTRLGSRAQADSGGGSDRSGASPANRRAGPEQGVGA